jgi:hypothetical protein
MTKHTEPTQAEHLAGVIAGNANTSMNMARNNEGQTTINNRISHENIFMVV